MKRENMAKANELNQAIIDYNDNIHNLVWLITAVKNCDKIEERFCLSKPYKILTSFKLRVLPWRVGVGVTENVVELPKETLPIACEAMLVYLRAERDKLITEFEEL